MWKGTGNIGNGCLSWCEGVMGIMEEGNGKGDV